MKDYAFYPEGDAELLIVIGREIRPEINRRVTRAVQRIRQAKIPGVLDLIPAFASLLVQYDPVRIGWSQIRDRIEKALEAGGAESGTEKLRVTEIPVCYGGEYGPDLENIAAHAGLPASEVIRIHTGRDYLIYMMGFLPGFPYLGNLDVRLHTPRRKEPRISIPAGSVGIGGAQTGIYPLTSPGGWHILGLTPVKLYDPDAEDPVLLRSGDVIRFRSVSEEEFREIEEAGGKLCI